MPELCLGAKRLQLQCVEEVMIYKKYFMRCVYCSKDATFYLIKMLDLTQPNFSVPVYITFTD
jgi:hypothetical protein